jgi:hypothetical protein
MEYSDGKVIANQETIARIKKFGLRKKERVDQALTRD